MWVVKGRGGWRVDSRVCDMVVGEVGGGGWRVEGVWLEGCGGDGVGCGGVVGRGCGCGAGGVCWGCCGGDWAGVKVE